MRPRGFCSPLRAIVASSILGLIQVTASGQTLPFANTNGLLYHLDASVGVTLDGTGVSGWQDLTGHGYNFLQSDPLKQPTLVTDGIGGRPAIRFDGNITGNLDGVAPQADELLLGVSTSVRTFVAVNRLAPGNLSLAGIWGIEGQDTGVRRTGTPLGNWQGGPGTPGSNTNDFAGPTGVMLVNGIANNAVAENVPHVVLAQRPANMTFSATSIGDYFKAGTTVAPRPYKGDISEIMVFDRELSTQEQKELSIHLAAKYQAGGGGMVYSVGGAGIASTQVFGGTKARYIRIHTDASGLPADTTSTDVNRFGFHLAELEVFSTQNPSVSLDPGSNLAFSGNGATFTTLIGQGGHGADSNAINGVLDKSAAVWTRNPVLVDGVLVPGPIEARLDLGTERLVGSVRLWQRPDGVPERLRDFTVTVEDVNGQVLQTFQYPNPELGQFGAVQNSVQFNLDITTNEFTVGPRDILSLEVSPFTGASDLLLIGEHGDGILKLEPGASLAILNLEGVGNFTIGQSFHILGFSSVQGTFETISLPGGHSMWDLSDLYTDGVITVVPEPSSFAMLLGGALFFGGRLRRGRR